MATKRGYKGIFRKVVAELKVLHRKERRLIPQLYPECELENKILLGCELLHSYMRQKRKTGNTICQFNYPNFVVCGLFEKGSRLVYGDFSKLGFEKDFLFIGEFQWRLTLERVDLPRIPNFN